MNLNQITVPSLDLTKAIPFYQKLGLVYFECNHLDDYVNNLMQQGIEFEQQPTDENWLWREARLKDLDGNQLILYYAGENRLNPPWRIENS